MWSQHEEDATWVAIKLTTFELTIMGNVGDKKDLKFGYVHVSFCEYNKIFWAHIVIKIESVVR